MKRDATADEIIEAMIIVRQNIAVGTNLMFVQQEIALRMQGLELFFKALDAVQNRNATSKG